MNGEHSVRNCGYHVKKMPLVDAKGRRGASFISLSKKLNKHINI